MAISMHGGAGVPIGSERNQMQGDGLLPLGLLVGSPY